MAGSSSQQDVFDLRKIRRLVELMKEHDLGEIDLRQGESRLRLRRGVSPPVIERVVPEPIAPTGASPQPQAATASTDDGDHMVVIKSPMVGTFYASADPESPPYAKVGDHVGVDTTICIVEAMKVFNQIPAEVSGKIVAVLVEDGEPVEFGHPLFRVDTRQ